MIDAMQALANLKDGNRRFREGRPRRTHTHASESRRNSLTGGQAPFAIVLGCSDSRVPAEIVFDQGLGDLFVIRVAGNIASSSQIGSVEFAVDKFATPLVVVLGHTSCGAIQETVNLLQRGTRAPSDHLQAIVNMIHASVEAPREAATAGDTDSLIARVTRANIRSSAKTLLDGSAILKGKVDAGALMVVGAEYALDSGAVTFLDEAGDDGVAGP